MWVVVHSLWASHLLLGLGNDALVANAQKPRSIYHNSREAGRTDAETIARLACLDLELPPDGDLRLYPIHHRSTQA